MQCIFSDHSGIKWEMNDSSFDIKFPKEIWKPNNILLNNPCEWIWKYEVLDYHVLNILSIKFGGRL